MIKSHLLANPIIQDDIGDTLAGCLTCLAESAGGINESELSPNAFVGLQMF
ncbi:MAG: hypothetical protein ACJA0C_000563 [Candidatus Endobugula sp.]|jgi:hypothetical protein